jgi:hypothetical protein
VVVDRIAELGRVEVAGGQYLNAAAHEGQQRRLIHNAAADHDLLGRERADHVVEAKRQVLGFEQPRTLISDLLRRTTPGSYVAPPLSER